MITVRVGAKTEALVERLARRRGQTKSELVRDAVQQLIEPEDRGHSEGTAHERLGSLIGCWNSGGMNLSQNTGEKFAELLRRKTKRAGGPD
jgi:metal-responsive CopG/Arc/MetJ family transcriptional regulator